MKVTKIADIKMRVTLIVKPKLVLKVILTIMPTTLKTNQRGERVQSH